MTNEYPHSMFFVKIRKIMHTLNKYTQVLIYKMGFKGVCLNLMRTHNLCFEQNKKISGIFD